MIQIERISMNLRNTISVSTLVCCLISFLGGDGLGLTPTEEIVNSFQTGQVSEPVQEHAHGPLDGAHGCAGHDPCSHHCHFGHCPCLSANSRSELAVFEDKVSSQFHGADAISKSYSSGLFRPPIA